MSIATTHLDPFDAVAEEYRQWQATENGLATRRQQLNGLVEDPLPRLVVAIINDVQRKIKPAGMGIGKRDSDGPFAFMDVFGTTRYSASLGGRQRDDRVAILRYRVVKPAEIRCAIKREIPSSCAFEQREIKANGQELSEEDVRQSLADFAR